ncbi:thioredoxin family protein [Candidatus Poribacteria bacterium]
MADDSVKYWDMNQEFSRGKFEKALSYKAYMEASPDNKQRWQEVYDRVALTDDQKALLGGFTRKMNVLCMSGAWCGDCVRQGPMLQRIAEGSDVIDLRFLDRDLNPDLRERLRVLGGMRVPVVVFLSEDFFECDRFGAKTLSTYRKMAAEQVGIACPTGIIPSPENELELGVQDWLDMFERVQLALRLSPMLRQRYND